VHSSIAVFSLSLYGACRFPYNGVTWMVTID
jgi:hypothetical protein